MEKLLILDRKLSEKLRLRTQTGVRFTLTAALAQTGDSWLWCGVLLIFWLFSSGEREKTLAFWGGSIALTALFIFVLKRIIHRKRPEGEWGKIYREGDPHSFPSGHAVRAGLIVCLTWSTFTNPLIRCFVLIWAVGMMLSRVITGLHYLSDIIAGFIFGLGIGWLWCVLKPCIFSSFPLLFDKSSWFRRG